MGTKWAGLTEDEKRIIHERYQVYIANRPKRIAQDFNISRTQVEYIGKKVRANANPSPPRARQEDNPDPLREGCGASEETVGPRLDKRDT